VQTIRVLVEGFLRGRYELRLRPLAVPVLIGAILVVGWVLLGPLLTIPRFSAGGPVVRNGVAAVLVCGKKSGPGKGGDLLMSRQNLEGMDAAMEYVPEPRTGTWWPERSRRGDCTIWYHRPPGLEQRHNRQERAANPSASSEMLPPEGARRSPSEFQKLPVVEKLPADER
jgi:hypothetical protein